MKILLLILGYASSEHLYPQFKPFIPNYVGYEYVEEKEIAKYCKAKFKKSTFCVSKDDPGERENTSIDSSLSSSSIEYCIKCMVKKTETERFQHLHDLSGYERYADPEIRSWNVSYFNWIKFKLNPHDNKDWIHLNDVRAAMDKATSYFADANIRFREVTTEDEHILISFVSNDDYEKITNDLGIESGSKAFAQMPPKNQDSMTYPANITFRAEKYVWTFDRDDPFTDTRYGAEKDDKIEVNVFLTLLHELGHAIGLAHSGISDINLSIMSAQLHSNIQSMTIKEFPKELPYLDRLAILRLYGKRKINIALLVTGCTICLVIVVAVIILHYVCKDNKGHIGSHVDGETV